ncbi:MAG: phosphatase domain-containing protein [Verrucomicrobiota bacterium]
MHSRIHKFIALAVFTLLLSEGAVISKVKALTSDEQIQWFPALATPQLDGWKVTLSGLVTEDKTRPTTSWLARKLLGFSNEELGSKERAIFRERTQRFLADDETGKRMHIEILGKRYDFGRTGRNGQFGGTILLSGDALNPGKQTLPCVVFSNRRAYTNAVPVGAVGRQGISVVSDIDDTIKISDVRNRDELMRNTFLRPFRAVDGLADVYRQWSKDSGAQFHYVSGSPWQLFPALQTFIETNGFPIGSWHLRSVRLLGLSAMELRKTPDVHKRKMIEELLTRLPDRKFVLVGDSGERDPEIYADLLRRHPHRVARIFIRDVTGEPMSSQRYVTAFKELPKGSWTIFKSADELPRSLEK